MFKLFNKKIKENTSRGFTLVEMVIVAGIFSVLTVIVVLKYGDFTSNLLVTNMAYEIALTTRQAQAFGVGVRGFELDGDRDFGYPYGVFFNLNDGTSETGTLARSFIFFVDRDENLLCDDGIDGPGVSNCICAEGDECINQFTLQRNIRITSIDIGNESYNCTSTTATSVTFKRPSPEARIIKQEGDFDEGLGFVQLKVEAPATETNPSYVLIRKNGQISVSGNNICGPSSNSDGNSNE